MPKGLESGCNLCGESFAAHGNDENAPCPRMSVNEMLNQLFQLRQLLVRQDLDPDLTWVFYEKVPIRTINLNPDRDGVDVILKG